MAGASNGSENPGDDPGSSFDRDLDVSAAFIANLILAILLGVGGNFWILRYTERFPEVGGVLALTGAFS